MEGGASNLFDHHVYVMFCAGFAFVQFEDRRDAEDSVKEMDGKRVCGVHIRVEIAKSRK